MLLISHIKDYPNDNMSLLYQKQNASTENAAQDCFTIKNDSVWFQPLRMFTLLAQGELGEHRLTCSDG